MRGLVAAVLACAACIEPSLIPCGDLACAPSQVCDSIHQRCVAPLQLEVCAGLEPGADCVAGPISGGCIDGVCLERGCGNGIVETSEACDDFNQASGDGCRNDCLSDETCGNRVVDIGEQCDDGNHLAHDGCDSTCVTEQVIWTVEPLIPLCITGAYDVARDAYVCITRDATWELVGQHWERRAVETLVDAQLYYDTKRARVAGVLKASGALHAWDGTHWSMINAGVGATVIEVGYDEKRELSLAFTNVGSVFSLDIAGVWQAEPSLDVTGLAPGGATWTITDITATYDPTRELVHVFGRVNRVETPCEGCEVSYVDFYRWEYGAAGNARYPTHASTLSVTHFHDGRVIGIAPGGVGELVDHNRVRTISSTGVVTTVAGRMFDETSKRITSPTTLANDAQGRLLVIDYTASSLFRIDGEVVTRLAGTGETGLGGEGVPAAGSPLTTPTDVEVDSQGNIYISEFSAGRIRRIAASDGTISTLVNVASPRAIAFDAAENLYIASGNQIVKRTPAGVVTVIAGTGAYGYDGDGGPATEATLSEPRALAIDDDGQVYIAATFSIRRIDTDGMIDTVVGNNTDTQPNDGDLGTDVGVFASDLAIDADGLLYLDIFGECLRRLHPDGTITTIAGRGTLTADGALAADSSLSGIVSISLDAQDNVFVLTQGGIRWEGLVALPGSMQGLYRNASNALVAISFSHTYELADGSIVWTAHHLDRPSAAIVATSAYGGLLGYEPFYGTNAARLWTWDGAEWARSETAPPSLSLDDETHAVACDWSRDTTALVVGGNTYTYDGTDFDLLGPAPQLLVIAFDPELPGLIGSSGYDYLPGSLYALPRTATQWTHVQSLDTLFRDQSFRSMAYDARTSTMLAVASGGLVLERQSDGQWRDSLPLKDGYSLVADERRGVLMAVPLSGNDTRVYERQNGWVEVEEMPLAIAGRAAYDARTGRLMFSGGPSYEPPGPGNLFTITRQLTSGAPDEACDGLDADGDNLSDCADPDCYWACGKCPPYTSCAGVP